MEIKRNCLAGQKMKRSRQTDRDKIS